MRCDIFYSNNEVKLIYSFIQQKLYVHITYPSLYRMLRIWRWITYSWFLSTKRHSLMGVSDMKTDNYNATWFLESFRYEWSAGDIEEEAIKGALESYTESFCEQKDPLLRHHIGEDVKQAVGNFRTQGRLGLYIYVQVGSQLHMVMVEVMEMRSPITRVQGNKRRGEMMELWKGNSVGRGSWKRKR